MPECRRPDLGCLKRYLPQLKLMAGMLLTFATRRTKMKMPKLITIAQTIESCLFLPHVLWDLQKFPD